MTNYFVLKKDLTLSINEQIIYAIISANSNSKVSKITRNKLSLLSGLTSLHTISNLTEKLTLREFIKKNMQRLNDGKTIVDYWLIEPNNNYILCSNNLLNIDATLMAIAIKLASLRYGASPFIYMDDKTIISEIHISKNTFYKYKQQLIDLNIISPTESGYKVSTIFFPIKEDDTEETYKLEHDLLTLLKACKTNIPRNLKIFFDYYTTKYITLKGNKTDFLRWCLAGCPKDNKDAIPNEYNFSM